MDDSPCTVQPGLNRARRHATDFGDFGYGKFLKIMQDDGFSVCWVKSAESHFDGIDGGEHFDSSIPRGNLADLVSWRMAIMFAEPISNRPPRDAIEPSG
jgi:hypothetical protein